MLEQSAPQHDLASLRLKGEAIALRLHEMKRDLTVPDYGWYPYDTITSLPILLELLEPRLEEVLNAIGQSGLADLGAGDGDLAVYFSSLGFSTTAIDHAQTNFNQLRGLHLARKTLAPELSLFDIDLDQPFALPQPNYGLALFLGTLYHLRNPLYVLDKLAAVADWCVLSTRIAQVTRDARTRIEDEPVAYLLGTREANNDPTNFWIFSFTGLTRLLERSGWVLTSYRRLGCSLDSNPVDAAADERVLLLAKSRIRDSAIHIRLLQGWHHAEEAAFHWTEKRFGIEVTTPLESQEFALRFSVPDCVLADGGLSLACSIEGHTAGAMTCDEPGTFEFRGRFLNRGITHQLQFVVTSSFKPPVDQRELGICVPLSPVRGVPQIGFRVS